MEQKEYGMFLARMLYKSGIEKLPWSIGSEAAKWFKIELNRLYNEEEYGIKRYCKSSNR